MKRLILIALGVLWFSSPSVLASGKFSELKKSNKVATGFVDFVFDDDSGKFYLKVNNIGQEFIYQSSLPQGLGSNDIGLDRGQLSDVRLVEFQLVGNKLLLIQKNTNYRAVTSNQKEKDSVEQAFAPAVIWGFKVVEKSEKWALVDASDFILSDSHGVARRLAQTKQGNYSLDKSRSAIYLPRTKAFPDNTEIEATVTFVGKKPGEFVKQAVIDPYAITLRTHHSFIRLPKAGYKPRKFDPKSGYWLFSYQDYAQPINQPLTQKFIARHRLEKKHPNQKISEAVQPIIYYLDPGAPEPVKTALIEGAMWWNQAFESIGYKNAFQVKILPENADPMDVRYNVIQWVHRATRGWSYGYGVTDPRNGEIIKGHVTLGSLRVRQDYLIAQGMLSRFGDMQDDQELMDLALARIRQLSAHEVGHTLGLAHNFAASTYGRASVMDYPHPLFDLEKDKITAENAYAEDIGIWDKAAIAYGYQTFKANEEAKGLSEILAKNKLNGWLFISDPDSRRISNAHPRASLWDNGENTIDELGRVIKLRELALKNFGLKSLHNGRAISDLQEILVPVYYFHRYQAEAAAKWIGGIHYEYDTKVEEAGDVKQEGLIARSTKDHSPIGYQFVSAKKQQQALAQILKTLEPEFLSISDQLNLLFNPKIYGDGLTRESSKRNTGVMFDRLSLAESAIQHSLSLILEPSRLARLQIQHSQDSKIDGVRSLLHRVKSQLTQNHFKDGLALIHQKSLSLFSDNLLNLIHSANVNNSIKSDAFATLNELNKWYDKQLKRNKYSDYYGFYLVESSKLKNLTVKRLDKKSLIPLPKMPPGSPI